MIRLPYDNFHFIKSSAIAENNKNKTAIPVDVIRVPEVLTKSFFPFNSGKALIKDIEEAAQAEQSKITAGAEKARKGTPVKIPLIVPSDRRDAEQAPTIYPKKQADIKAIRAPRRENEKKYATAIESAHKRVGPSPCASDEAPIATDDDIVYDIDPTTMPIR
jgi:hypothetical protein